MNSNIKTLFRLIFIYDNFRLYRYHNYHEEESCCKKHHVKNNLTESFVVMNNCYDHIDFFLMRSNFFEVQEYHIMQKY